ncbi:hypothetical protein WR25_24128 [Diploscapter pachys]|uniref:WD repeat domain phosphoinositide-interacting protein 2 n=1 Tax=Diploscapter pachys TaxID=2018661 RepID=A0A2A2K1S1_9BILA|nr:hypothetical protein WR25_24128 [Diploscapter pachys]
MFASSLVIIVSQQEPRSMHVYHFQSRNEIVTLKFGNTILNVKVNKERVVVCLEDSIFIYNLKDMKQLHTIMDTPLNKNGLIDLSAAPQSALVAYPGSSEAGTLHIFDAINLCAVNTFIAHDGPLAALKFNPDGTMLATASKKGTVIRVYSVPQGARLFEFRRGMTRCVTIYSLAFSPDSSFLCSSSNTETVHVFKLERADDEKHRQEASQDSAGGGGWFGGLGALMQQAQNYLPTQVNELITVERSFATARLPGSDKKNIAALTNLKNQLHLVVGTSDGYLYCYRVDTNAPSGGELDLVKQHRIGPNADAAARAGNEANSGRSRGGTNSGGSQGGGDSGSTPNVDDPDDFPPMSHTSG